MTTRRTFVIGTAALLAAPLTAEGQPAEKVPRIGALFPAEPASPTEPNTAALRQGLRDLGYVEGRTVAVEYRYAHGRAERYPELAVELIRLKVDVIVAGGPASFAARDATTTIPIIFVAVGDPVGSGLVPSLARPGGNISGLSGVLGEGLTGKCVELLKETVPKVSRVGYLRDAANPRTAQFLGDVQTAAQALNLKVRHLEVRELHELESAFGAMAKERGSGLVVMGEPLFFPHRSFVTELAAKYGLPAIYTWRVFVDAGGLMSYGPSLSDLWQRAASYVDKILKGARPGDLPVEQPTKYELVINKKTAKTLGLTIPPSLLLRADEVIQ